MTELAAVSPLEDDTPLDSLDSELEDSEPDEVPVDSEPEEVPVDSELEDSELLDVEPLDRSPVPALVAELLELLIVFAPVPPAAVCALRLDAVSAGSCPDASCT